MAKTKITAKKKTAPSRKKIVHRERTETVLDKEKLEAEEKVSSAPSKYYEAVGRRKTAQARVRMWTRGDREIIVNNKQYSQYFPTLHLQQVADAALRIMKCQDKFRVMALARGGGIAAQAEAVRHGISRALVLFNPDFRKRLKKAGYLTRDPRMRERKKFGLKRARKAAQWAKR
ncbi:MAG: 30S ribosomal protein S9 [Parcubacteria group bacterium GW2011_GWA2_47_9]|nr:MAG: 30S ribosomal protein S9 [Parcubacteria group bacterium GW2011_GWA2_47_9]